MSSYALELAQHVAALIPLCDDCQTDTGLCRQHARDVCPQLARAAWLRLIGQSLTEQKARQDQDTPLPDAPVSDASIAHAERKRAARTASRQRRRKHERVAMAFAA